MTFQPVLAASRESVLVQLFFFTCTGSLQAAGPGLKVIEVHYKFLGRIKVSRGKCHAQGSSKLTPVLGRERQVYHYTDCVHI
jgi:hypothetical protein